MIEKYDPRKKLVEELIESKDIFYYLRDEKAIERNVNEVLKDTDELISILQRTTEYEINSFNSYPPINNGVKWHIIYSEFAKALNQFYKNHGNESGERLFKEYKKQDSQYEILPWVKHFKEYNVSSLDPIHIFASFTYWNIPLDTRKKKMLFFCKLLKSFDIDTNELEADINKSIASNYQYFPHPNITNIVSPRNPKTQKEVWEFFSIVQNTDVDNEKLEELFNRINTDWYGVKLESATIFSFWINSDNFLPLDKNTLELLKKYNKVENIPSVYKEYKKLIEKKDTSLYRNLAKIANDENLRISLADKDGSELDSFLSVNISIRDNTGGSVVSDSSISRIIKEDSNIVKDFEFEFELYFIVSGKAKKIVYRDNKIEFQDNIEIKHNQKKETLSYQNFQLIAIKALSQIKKYTKVLNNNQFYYFNKNFEILDNGKLKINSEKNIDLYKGYQVQNINITAIVGSNGKGKSTIIDWLMMAFYNIVQSFDERYFSDFFYTIQMNYSMHALNSKKSEYKWVTNLFEKNNSYQIPIVIEPYRKEGNIDVNALEALTKQRLLSTILERHIIKDKEDDIAHTKLLENKYATHLKIKINKIREQEILDLLNKREDKSDGIDKVLNYDKNRQIIEYVKYFIGISKDSKIVQSYIEVAMLYICYEVQNIANSYDIYTSYQDKFYEKYFLNILMEDKTHRTFELHQLIYFLKYETVNPLEEIEIDTLSRYIEKIIQKDLEEKKKANKEENTLSVIELIPPPFFDIDIIVNKKISFDTLSSGEKQKIYSISSIIYHLQNIESMQINEYFN